MSNTTMKISLPDDLRTAAKRLSKKNQYSTVSGFMQSLIRREDKLDREREQLRKLIQEGIDSGLSDVPADVFFENGRKRIQAKIDAQ